MMNIFFDNIDKFNDRVAIITEESEQITYRSLIKESNKIVENIKPRSLVFLVCSNSLESVFAYIGFLRKRIVPVLINSNISIDLYEKLIETYKPSFIFLPSSKVQMFSKCDVVGKVRNYSLLKTDFEIDYTLNDELALLLTTSGSTGSPKLVRQSYKNINSNTKSIVDYLEIDKEDKAITTMPMSYTYGLSIINTHLYCGASIIVNEYTLMNKELWTLLKREKATTFGGVPYIYEMLKKLRFSHMDLPSLKYITQAGGKLSAELVEGFSDICKEKGIKLIVMYGQTEATARMAYLPWEYVKSKAGSMGIAIPGGEFVLVDENGKNIEAANVTGELVYKGDNVTLGYAESCYDLLKGDENNGVLYTGDMAKKDEDNFYYIVGRKKRFLKVFGSRINLDEVEGMLKLKGYEAICAGVDDKLKIYITNKEQQEEVLSYISRETGLNKSGFTVSYIEKIPRNEAGKILYSLLN